MSWSFMDILYEAIFCRSEFIICYKSFRLKFGNTTGFANQTARVKARAI